MSEKYSNDWIIWMPYLSFVRCNQRLQTLAAIRRSLGPKYSNIFIMSSWGNLHNKYCYGCRSHWSRYTYMLIHFKIKNKSTNTGLTIPGNWSFEIRRISWSPHEIWRISGEIHTKSGGFQVKSTWNPPISPEIRRISWMWAFGWSPSIGLSFERPIKKVLLQIRVDIRIKCKLFECMSHWFRCCRQHGILASSSDVFWFILHCRTF